jgi:predicted nucleotidyltransferase
MSNISFDLSGKIDSDTIDVLQAIKEAADSLSITFFVVGAAARDIILEHCYNVKPHRATLDVGLGVEVADWDQFNELSKTLISTGKFSDTKEPQRLLYNKSPVDIVPFGPIVNEDKKVSWPPEHEIFMSILGFKEAYEDSITVRLSNNSLLDIKLPTLPGLALMKLISWNEKYPNRSKDAEDLLFILNNYEKVVFHRLYEKESSLLEEEDFDVRIASIRLFGQDMVNIADPETLKKIKEILEHETGEQSRYRLIQDMIKGSMEVENKFEDVLNMLEKLKTEIMEVKPQST